MINGNYMYFDKIIINLDIIIMKNLKSKAKNLTEELNFAKSKEACYPILKPYRTNPYEVINIINEVDNVEAVVVAFDTYITGSNYSIVHNFVNAIGDEMKVSLLKSSQMKNYLMSFYGHSVVFDLLSKNINDVDLFVAVINYCNSDCLRDVVVMLPDTIIFDVFKKIDCKEDLVSVISIKRKELLVGKICKTKKRFKKIWTFMGDNTKGYLKNFIPKNFIISSELAVI